MAKRSKGTKVYVPKLDPKFRASLEKDFKNFLYVTWKFLGLPPPTKRQYEAADFLQDYSHKRRILEAYRGFGKSWITSAYALWKLFKDPNEKLLVISASGDRARHFTTFAQRLIIDLPFLRHLIPPKHMRWSTLAFDVNGAKPSHAPSVKASGVFSQITGSRATEIILDDVETINTVETELMRAKLMNVLKEMENIIVPGGIITYLGTPHHFDSIYGETKLLARGYRAFVIPARYPKLEDLDYYGNRLDPKIRDEVLKNPDLQGKPTDPERFDEEVLAMKELGGGKSNFAMQFMLDTRQSDELKYPLKLADLIVFEADSLKAPATIRHTNEPEFMWDFPGMGINGTDHVFKPSRIDTEWLPYNGVYMSIDPSGRGADETAYAIVAQLHGKLYLLDLGGFKGGYTDDTLMKLAQKAREYNVNKIFIEANYGDGMFTQVLKPVLAKYHKCTIEEVKHYKQKEVRIIDTLEPVMNQHRLVVDIDIIKREYVLYANDSTKPYSFIYQLTYLSREKDCLEHDDKIDALAIAVQAWQEALGLDSEKMLKQYKEQQLEEKLKSFLNTVNGYIVGQSRYSGPNFLEPYTSKRSLK